MPLILAGLVAVFAYAIIEDDWASNGMSAKGRPTYCKQIKISEIYSGKIHKNGTLYTELLRQEVPQNAVAQITKKFSQLFDLTTAHPGDRFKLFLTPEKDILTFEYETIDLKKYSLEKTDDGYLEHVSSVPLDKRIEFFSTVIQTNLKNAVADNIEDVDMFSRLTDIFSWEIDFLTEPQAGDLVKIVYQALYKDDKFIKYGDILAVEFDHDGIRHQAFLYEDPEGYTDYYDRNGYSLRRELLKSPLNYCHISSRFSQRRLHPIFKIFRPHLGIDYAAPVGTPVSAAGDGIISFMGWVHGFGNFIMIKHDFGLCTTYGHLNAYAKGLAAGRRVRQGEVIGYVGQTGFATGPHLDYRVKKNGRYVNPLKMTVPAAPPVKPEYMAEFKKIVSERLTYLNQPVKNRLLVLNR